MPSEYSRYSCQGKDGRQLSSLRWHPPGAVRARIILLHGIESHAQWFAGTCRWLAKLGFEVFFLERGGSGSDCEVGSAERGDFDGYRTWLEDVDCLAEQVRAMKPALKLHLMGISWGGKLACAVAVRPEPWMDSLILVTPGLVPCVGVSWIKRCAIAWSAFLAPLRRFALPIADTDMFTNSARWQDFIRDDALRVKRVTARFFLENFKLDRFLKKNQAAIHVPMLLMLAGNDRIIVNGETKRRCNSFASPRKKILEYPEAIHTLEFEPNPDLWRKDLLVWLDS